jgi:hypothetical protein
MKRKIIRNKAIYRIKRAQPLELLHDVLTSSVFLQNVEQNIIQR